MFLFSKEVVEFGYNYFCIPVVKSYVNQEMEIATFNKHFNVNNLNIKQYSSFYLHKLQYRNRKMELQESVIHNLVKLDIFKSFNHKRGASSVRKNKSYQRIQTIVSNPRRKSVNVNEKHLVNSRNLIKINNNLINYRFPKLIYSNLRSMCNKFEDVETFFKFSRANVGVFTETWLKESDIDAYNLKEFKAYHRIRQKTDKNGGGGVSIFVKNDISVLSVEYPDNVFIEALKLIFRSSFLPRDIPWQAIVAVYYPPSDFYGDDILRYISEQVDRLLSKNHLGNVFVIGDFNDLRVSNVMDGKIFQQLIKEPTRKNSILDKCFYKGAVKYLSEISAPIGQSDHNTIILTPNKTDDLFKLKDGTREYCYRPRKLSNLRSFGNDIVNIDWNFVYFHNDLDVLVDEFNNLLLSLYEKNYPLVKKKGHINDKPWCNDKINVLFKERNLNFKKGLVDKVYEINKKIHLESVLAKRKVFNDQLYKVNNNSSDYFKLLKDTLGINCKKNIKAFPNKSLNETYSEIANYFSKLYNSKNSLPMFMQDDTLKKIPIPKINQFWIKDQLSKIKNNNSSAPDNIPNFIFREFCVEIAEPLSYIINKSLETCYVPKAWKTSYLIPIPKDSNTTQPNQIRPISILPAISKIIERHIFVQLTELVFNNLDIYQFGGLAGRSTLHYLILYIHSILQSKDKNISETITLISDFEKAYDNLDHNILINELTKMNISQPLIQWLFSFLTNRCQIVKIPFESNPIKFGSSNGVPQGSVLGGMLFIIATDKIGRSFNQRYKYIDDMSIVLSTNFTDTSLYPKVF